MTHTAPRLLFCCLSLHPIFNQSVTILQWFNQFLLLLIVISHVSISFLYESCAVTAQTFKSHFITAAFCLWCKPSVLSFLWKFYISDLFHSLYHHRMRSSKAMNLFWREGCEVGIISRSCNRALLQEASVHLFTLSLFLSNSVHIFPKKRSSASKSVWIEPHYLFNK